MEKLPSRGMGGVITRPAYPWISRSFHRCVRRSYMEHARDRDYGLRVLAVGCRSAELVRIPSSSSRKRCFSNCGSDALDLLRSRTFDLVLSDLHLVDMIAMDLLKHIRRIDSGLTFVVTIDARQLRDALLAMIAGASGYVILGQSTNEVLDRIESAHKRNRLNTLLRKNQN